jgi:hypothetical protein
LKLHPRTPAQDKASPNTRWLSAYSITAGMHTKAGSGAMRRHRSTDTLLGVAARGS